jgi:very-short-patch-repair endonuclease
MSYLQSESPMEEVSMTAAAPAATLEQKILIEIEADATMGYASIQNAVPVVRALRLTNPLLDAQENLEVVISCSPAFARGLKLRFDRLAAGETRRISPLDLQPDHDFLADLKESVNASIRVVAEAGGQALASASRPVQVLAYDQWAGTRALPELLAAFCMPNHPAVDSLIGKASKLLRATHPELSMNGYQSKSRDVVWKQVSSIYSTIAAENLQYVEPPASFGTDGQKIRTPDRILEARVATCLDLAMLFASCLEQAGLRPVVLLKEGHAWVGVWLHLACFPDALLDDVQAIRKRVDSGELLVFETTGAAQHASYRPSLRMAMEQGHAHLLEDASFRYAIDIHRAREVQIKPLPSRAAPLKPGEALPDENAPAAIEPMPLLPPLDSDSLTPLEMPQSDTPEGRLSTWKSRLLDLTLRNRLLNFKPAKATLQFVAPDLAQLEDALADGAEFKIRPLPELMEGADPRMAQVHTQRAGRTPLDDMALQALGNKELLAQSSKEALDGNLLAIYSAARTGLEEGGANTLYLAIGLLRWTEAEKADAVHLAPLLLIPVTLQRQSVRSGFRLMRYDDEAIVNPTLLHLLKTSFELKVAGLDVVPADDKGVDVAQVLQSFRLAVREIPQWEVLEQAHLGIFSFTKYLMWKDLQDRTEQLKLSRVVRHLIDNPGEAFPRESMEGEFDRLDITYRPQDILTPMLSDSSQLKAICAVDAGRDLVLEGPPGTGKSQTITNLIAHSLAKGKTVLFVSEKMAALEVVHRRLTSIGLGPFCLELHSSKAKKSEVLQQLGKSLAISAQRTADDWAREADRLAQLRQSLNGLVDSLHREYQNGFTVFEATGACIAHTGEAPSAMPWADPLLHDRADLDRLEETARRMASLAGALETLQDHPLSLMGQTDWSNTWQEAVLEAAQSLEAGISLLREKSAALATLTSQSTAGLSLQAYAALDQLADVLLLAPNVPAGLAGQAHDPDARARVHALAQHGMARNEHWQQVGPGWTPQVATLNAVELQAQWAQARSDWWPKSMLAQRAITGRLSGFRTDQQRPVEAEVQALLAPLAALNEEDRALRAMQPDAEALLQTSYVGLKTDWASLADHELWAKTFADAVTRYAGADLGLAASLHQALGPLVSSNRAALSASGAAGHALLAYRDAWREFSQKRDALDTLAQPVEPLQGPAGADGALERIQGVLGAWQGSRRLIQPWSLWRKVRAQAVDQGLQGLVTSLETGAVPLSQVESHFKFSYCNWWLKKTIDSDPVLRGFSSADHGRKIREFQGADERFQTLTEHYIVATLSGRIPSLSGDAVGPDSELGRLRRELQKQRRQMPVRQLVHGLPTLLPKLKPCLLMSPLSVAQYLDAGYAPFDLVVFDEASQIPVWDAVGAIARGRQLVVVGDPKQLPPTSFFSKSSDPENAGMGDEQVEDLESILDECLGAGMNRLSLQWHYRSRHESLITFSNVNYYESSLVTFPSPVTNDSAVRFERVKGVYDRGGSRTNRAEADAIIEGISAHYLSPQKKHLTLGVVTFNQTQQLLIETLLDARRRANPELDRAIAARAQEPLFIKNLENVQGDERDVIFFSITYGPDASGKTTMNFGPLNGEGGQRRLNVAISRAREAVVIYSTLLPEQIDLARVRAAGVRDLKHYLEFALKGYRALASQSLPTGREPDSPFETAVIRLLRSHGWDVHPQVGCSGYRIDIGVVDPRAPGRYLAGIECDGASYHSAATSRDRDRLRQHVLEGLGWRILRIWSTDWWLNPEGEIDKITRRLKAILDLPDAMQAEAEPEVAAVPVDAKNLEAEELSGEQGSDQEGVLDETASANPALEIYRPTTLPGGDSLSFHEPSASASLIEHLTLVIEAEGPLPEANLFRKVARAWGLERTGTRVVERLRTLVPDRMVRTIETEAIFYWPAESDITSWERLRIADAGDELSRRRIDEVCLEEVSTLAHHVLNQAGASSRQDVARSVCRLLGMTRIPADAQARTDEALDRLIALEIVVEVEGQVRLVA